VYCDTLKSCRSLYGRYVDYQTLRNVQSANTLRAPLRAMWSKLYGPTRRNVSCDLLASAATTSHSIWRILSTASTSATCKQNR